MAKRRQLKQNPSWLLHWAPPLKTHRWIKREHQRRSVTFYHRLLPLLLQLPESWHQQPWKNQPRQVMKKYLSFYDVLIFFKSQIIDDAKRIKRTGVWSKQGLKVAPPSPPESWRLDCPYEKVTMKPNQRLKIQMFGTIISRALVVCPWHCPLVAVHMYNSLQSSRRPGAQPWWPLKTCLWRQEIHSQWKKSAQHDEFLTSCQAVWFIYVVLFFWIPVTLDCLGIFLCSYWLDWDCCILPLSELVWDSVLAPEVK